MLSHFAGFGGQVNAAAVRGHPGCTSAPSIAKEKHSQDVELCGERSKLWICAYPLTCLPCLPELLSCRFSYPKFFFISKPLPRLLDLDIEPLIIMSNLKFYGGVFQNQWVSRTHFEFTPMFLVWFVSKWMSLISHFVGFMLLVKQHLEVAIS